MWKSIDTAPLNGTPVLLRLPKPIKSYDLAGYVPFDEIQTIIGWWGGSAWQGCFGEHHDSGCPTCGSWFEYPILNPVEWMELP